MLFSCLLYTSRKASSANVLLPKTNFPLHIKSNKRSERDVWIMKEASFQQLYEWQRKNAQNNKEFILHDGPPYANGKPHMGHALNKILKDFIIRFKLLGGMQVHFVPGWDCHGLPIELKALETFNMSKSNSPIEIREKAKSFALKTIHIQRSAFERWGVMADWENSCYFTFSPNYVVSQLNIFLDLCEKGFVYRDYKPVYWSPSSRTALAESELEYHDDHKSLSLFLKFPLKSPHQELTTYECKNAPINLVVWTTTPWTIPANQAICFNPGKDYCLVEKKNGQNCEYLVLAEELRYSLEQLWCCMLPVIKQFPGSALAGKYYFHPLEKSKSFPLLPSNHVSVKKGTGLVHTAPAHGPDDFLVALRHKIPIVNLVDEHGCFSEKAGNNLSGLNVLGEGQEKILKLLDKHIIFQETFKHSYPYDWRTKLPVILRASLQWFIDTSKIKKQALEAMDRVTVTPPNFEKPMLNQLASRPYWCISRQRSWGVPIPVFYTSDPSKSEALINRDIIERVCGIIQEKGIDQWWLMSPEDLIGNELIKKLSFTKGCIWKSMDIMDIWFDSGVSWNSVLPKGIQADMYLEGVDQFGGWFQSSLLTSVACTGRSPYKSIFVHGFVLDHNGRKMSKSQGNVVDPLNIIEGNGNDQPAFGIDVLRWWTASHVAGNGSSVSISSQMIRQASEDVQKIRAVMRFLLGNLNNVSEEKLDMVKLENLSLVDQYILHLLTEFVEMAKSSYEILNFRKVTSLISYFVNNHVSAFYCSVVKDRLYCSGPSSQKRMSALYALSQILDQTTLIIAPILPHLTEEIEIYHPWRSGKGGLFRNRKFSKLINFKDCSLESLFTLCLALRNSVNKIIGSMNTQEWSVHIVTFDKKDREVLKKFQADELSYTSSLCELLQVSSVSLRDHLKTDLPPRELQNSTDLLNFELHQSGLIQVSLTKSQLNVCPRCRRYTSFDKGLCTACVKVTSN